MELDFLGGVGKVGLEQGVGQQPSYALEDELEVLGDRTGLPPAQNTPANASSLSHNLTISNRGAQVWTLLLSTPESRVSAFPPASQRTPYARLKLPVTPRWTSEPGSLTTWIPC